MPEITMTASPPEAEATVETTPTIDVDQGATETLMLVEADLLVEDVSIDGMCGVY